MSSLVIQSEQATGKTLWSEPLRILLNADHIIDEYFPGNDIPDNSIALTTIPTPYSVRLGDLLVAMGYSINQGGTMSIDRIRELMRRMP